MQSLILATSLALSTPASISSFDNKEVLDELVNAQVNVVATSVSHQAKVSIQDSFLYQAKLAIKSASLDMANNTMSDVKAAE